MHSLKSLFIQDFSCPSTQLKLLTGQSLITHNLITTIPFSCQQTCPCTCSAQSTTAKQSQHSTPSTPTNSKWLIFTFKAPHSLQSPISLISHPLLEVLFLSLTHNTNGSFFKGQIEAKNFVLTLPCCSSYLRGFSKFLVSSQCPPKALLSRDVF